MDLKELGLEAPSNSSMRKLHWLNYEASASTCALNFNKVICPQKMSPVAIVYCLLSGSRILWPTPVDPDHKGIAEVHGRTRELPVDSLHPSRRVPGLSPVHCRRDSGGRSVSLSVSTSRYPIVMSFHDNCLHSMRVLSVLADNSQPGAVFKYAHWMSTL